MNFSRELKIALSKVGMMLNRRNFAAKGLAASLCAAVSYIALPAAAFEVDGIIGSNDNYTDFYDLDFAIEGGNTLDQNSGGKLSVGVEGGNVFVHLLLPTDLVDNVYQPSGNPPGWPKGHSYKNLSGSDKFEFSINTTNAANPVGVSVGYIGTDPTVGILSDNETVNTSGLLLAADTSLRYNLTAPTNTFGTGGDNGSSPDPNNPPADVVVNGTIYHWQQAYQYEFQLDGTNLDLTNGFKTADLSLPLLHLSPNKLGGNKVHIPCLENTTDTGGFPDHTGDKVPHDSTSLCKTTDGGDGGNGTGVPEPASGALALMGLGLMSLYRRRKTAARP